MKANAEQAFLAGESIVRTSRYLTVLTLPLICWLAGQSCPSQMLLAWVVQRATALLTRPRVTTEARENFAPKCRQPLCPIVSPST
jgi:hypothetical protein